MPSKAAQNRGSPVDRARTGSKHHLIPGGHAISLTGGNRNDVTELIPLIDQIPPVRSKCGRPRFRPDVAAAAGDFGGPLRVTIPNRWCAPAPPIRRGPAT
ncbi:hypothetical protein GCM10011609_49140 [Lentzea pudingi]|uniref:Transposase DDE domain-containing protein n=1 Tax=Lentzea pudingi TaxID=1789439 RepID=A0ABQ2I912_9PSEU|nr:hypothetical protein GCM10011609_49140 [Lentzea pudingi]